MEHIRLTDATLMEYAGATSLQLMRYVAVHYLGVPMTSIEIWQEKWRQNIVMINYECLAYWRCKNSGPGAKNKLDRILARASMKRTFWGIGTVAGTVAQCSKWSPSSRPRRIKKRLGRQIMDPVRPAGRACSQLPVSFWIFQIGPLLREIRPLLWSNVRIMFSHFFKQFNFFTFFVWAGSFLCGRTTLEGSPSCGRVIILTSLEHCYYMV